MNIELSKLSLEDFQAGQTLLIDKPLEWTSFDAVKKIRYLIKRKFKIKKIKVGHAGTLDPLATGLLLICIGKHTKEISKLTLESKRYSGVFRLGATTPSYDLETEPENFQSVDHLTEEMIKKAADELTGKIMQVPPIFSAKWVDGKRAYEAAREGKDIELKANPVEIMEFKVDCSNLPDLKFDILCSKGTYIRSIAHDIGQKLGVGAHLTELRRTAIGDYPVKDALSIFEFEDQLKGTD